MNEIDNLIEELNRNLELAKSDYQHSVKLYREDKASLNRVTLDQGICVGLERAIEAARRLKNR